MKLQLTLTIFAVLAIATVAGAQQVEFNYEGRILVEDVPFTGDGYFKFAIISKKTGGITIWSNDGTSTTGDEPAAAVIVPVTSGIFNVVIGDVSIANMAGLDASMFNARDQVFLRVWFSDTGSGFEWLKPDRKITNPALLGSQSFSVLDLYVDPVLGDDENAGNDHTRPKQTIQSCLLRDGG